MDDTPTRLSPITCDLWLPRGPEVSCEVLSVQGTEKLSEPFRFEIEIWCDDPDAGLDALLGADAELALDRSGLQRTFYGIIAKLEVKLTTPGRSQRDGVGARIVVVPAFALLEHEWQTRFFTGQSVIQILATVLGDRLGAYERSIDLESHIAGSYQARDYCVQFRESTSAFCSRLLAEEGIAYMFEADHDAQRERMMLVDANDQYVAAELLVAGPIAIEHDRPEQLDRESVQTLDLRQGIASNRVVTRGYNFKLANPVDEGDAALSEQRSVARTQVHEGVQRQIIDDPVGDPGAASFDGSALDQQVPLARRLLESLRGEAAVGRGRANAIGFAAGRTVEFEHSLAGGTRAILLTRVVHHIERDAKHGYSYHNEFECIPLAQAFRPKRRPDKPRVQGVQTAIVVGKQPDEVHTDRFGRVQVVFPLLAGSEAEQPSCWIRVAQVWAGHGYGTMVIPRVGMEVVVSFVDGDPDQPLITGCVYNGKNLPPYELPEELSKSTFKSNSTPGGQDYSELRIEDAKDHEQLFVRAQRRMDLRVSGTMYETATGGHEATVGAHTGSATPSTTIDARTVRGNVHHYVSQDQRSQIFGKSSVEAAAVYDASLGERLTWSNGTHSITAPDIISEASSTISQSADVIILAGSDSVSVEGGSSVVVHSNNSIELRVGQSFISVHQAGIDIVGPKIRLNSGGGVGYGCFAGFSVEEFELPLPYEALQADDGRGSRGGGGGGGAGSRDRGSRSLTPHAAPPMVPPRPVKPWTPAPIDETGTWLSMSWMQQQVWCSEPAKLGFITLGVEPGAHQSGFFMDAVGGDVIGAFAVVVEEHVFDLPVSICDVFPRRLPDDTVEPSREVHAQLSNGLSTPIPLTLRFLTSLPSFDYSEVRARFSISMHDGHVMIENAIYYVLGIMHGIISLGGLVEQDTGGVIGGSIDGLFDYRYCKKSPSDEDPDALTYWNGHSWLPVPKEFEAHNSLGDKLQGMALWRDSKGQLRKQFGTLPWPDPDIDVSWSTPSLGTLEGKLAQWTTAITEAWTGAFRLHRDQCRAYENSCCSHYIDCNVHFALLDAPHPHFIVITENDVRANAGAWPITESDRTAIHEFGHHLGNPDEYPGASTVNIFVNGDGAKFGIDHDSIMGSGEDIRARHFNTLAKALTKLVHQETGMAFTFSPV